MGTAMVLNSTIRFSPGTNLFVYVLIWAACIAGIGIVAWAALRSKRWQRWTTQDILIVAALGVLPVRPGATRGLRAAADTAGIAWPE